RQLDRAIDVILARENSRRPRMRWRKLLHSCARVADKSETNTRRRGRPPAGQNPGERVSDYPRFALRLPDSTFDLIQALAEASDVPQWRVISDAVDTYIASLPQDQQSLVV